MHGSQESQPFPQSISERSKKFSGEKSKSQSLKTPYSSHHATSSTQLLSTSLIRKLSFWFQHNSTKESYDTNDIV